MARCHLILRSFSFYIHQMLIKYSSNIHPIWDQIGTRAPKTKEKDINNNPRIKWHAATWSWGHLEAQNDSQCGRFCLVLNIYGIYIYIYMYISISHCKIPVIYISYISHSWPYSWPVCLAKERWGYSHIGYRILDICFVNVCNIKYQYYSYYY